MRAVIVGQYNPFGENVGGIEVFVDNLYRQLTKRGIKATLIGWANVRKKKMGFTPVCVSKKIRGAKFSACLLLKGPFLSIPKDAVIHVNRPDHVLPFMFRKNKIVCTLHGAHIKNVMLKKGRILAAFFNLMQMIAFKRADKVICVSSEDMGFFIERYPVLKGKVEVIPVGVDTEMFKPADRNKARKTFGFSSKDKIGLFIGRLAKEKQVDLLIKAFKNLGFAKLVIVGTGPEEANLKKMAGKNVMFMGKIPHSGISAIINCADVFLLSSKHEGMPTVVLEALACGVPVVSTKVGDVPKVVINGRTGFLAEKNRMESAIRNVLKSGTKMKKECIKVASQYSWKNIAKRIIKVYNEVSP